MKTEQPVLITTIKAQADLSKNYFTGFDGKLCGAGLKALGVCNADTISAEMMPVTVKGIALIYSGDAVSQADALESDASGKAITVSAGIANGYALDAATGADELIRILLI